MAVGQGVWGAGHLQMSAAYFPLQQVSQARQIVYSIRKRPVSRSTRGYRLGYSGSEQPDSLRLYLSGAGAQCQLAIE